MTIKTGLGERLLVGEYDLGNVTQLVNGSMSITQLDVTTIDLDGIARLGGKRHGTLSPTVFFDDSTGKSMDALKAVSGTDRGAVWLLGDTRGSQALALVSIQTMFGPQISQDGALVIPVGLEANNYGMEGGVVLTESLEAITTTTALAGVDDLGAVGSTDFGAQAFLNITEFTGTSITIDVEDSDDNGVDPWASCGLTFTAATGVGWERIATPSATENVKRWLRVNPAGTFTSCSFTVVVIRNHTARAF